MINDAHSANLEMPTVHISNKKQLNSSGTKIGFSVNVVNVRNNNNNLLYIAPQSANNKSKNR